MKGKNPPDRRSALGRGIRPSLPHRNPANPEGVGVAPTGSWGVTCLECGRERIGVRLKQLAIVQARLHVVLEHGRTGAAARVWQEIELDPDSELGDEFERFSVDPPKRERGKK